MNATKLFPETSAIHPRSRRGLLAGAALRIAALSLAAFLSADCASAAADTSALLRLTSNYDYRGYTLSDNDAAVQANIDIAWSNGLFLGTWASTADFGGADMALNPYVGKALDLWPDWHLVTSVAGYFFDGKVNDVNASYWEGTLRLAYRDIVSVQANVAPDYYGTGSTVLSYEIEFHYPLSQDIEVSGGLGYQASRNALNYDGVYSNVGIAWFVLPYLTFDLRYHNLHEMNERPYENYATEPLGEYHLDTPVILSVSIGL